MNALTPFKVKRVVVALESACENLAALERAARLAQRTKAELHAIFLEDPRLFEAAALPFTRYVCLASGTRGPLETSKIEQDLHAMAERARRRLKELADRFNVTCSFEAVRGDRSAAMDNAGCDDLLVMDSVTRGMGRFLSLPSDWSKAVTNCGRSCLLLAPGAVEARNILVLHDGSPAADRALAAARAMDGEGGAKLILARVSGATSTPDRTLEIRDLMTVNAAELRRAIGHERCGLVVVPASLVAGHQADLADFLSSPSCALLIVA
jgi:nucleotide-binding universal stress UspA family protein